MSNGNSFANGNSLAAVGGEVGMPWWFRVLVVPRPAGGQR